MNQPEKFGRQKTEVKSADRVPRRDFVIRSTLAAAVALFAPSSAEADETAEKPLPFTIDQAPLLFSHPYGKHPPLSIVLKDVRTSPLQIRVVDPNGTSSPMHGGVANGLGRYGVPAPAGGWNADHNGRYVVEYVDGTATRTLCEFDIALPKNDAKETGDVPRLLHAYMNENNISLSLEIPSDVDMTTCGVEDIVFVDSKGTEIPMTGLQKRDVDRTDFLSAYFAPRDLKPGAYDVVFKGAGMKTVDGRPMQPYGLGKIRVP